MTLALPNSAPPAPRRQLLTTVGIASAGVATLVGGMLAMWMKFRAEAPTRTDEVRGLIKDWMPADIKVPLVAANTMMITVVAIAIMAQWAVYSGKRDDSQHRSLALAVAFVLNIALINAQVAVYTQMEVDVAAGAFQMMFYTITGTMMLLFVLGMVFTAVAWFRSVGGRNDGSRIVSAHALYWYVLTAAFTAVWFIVYIQK